MLKKFIIGTLALVFLATAGVAAAYDFGTTTLKVGSKGEAVKTLQVLVGATPVDGSFGPMTKAKVMAWQANNGLTADGLFGNASKAKANLGGAVSGNFPAGCSSASGFSTTTGLPCVAIPSTGCPAGALFNSQTGASCTPGAVVTTGAAGSMSLTSTSTDVEDKLVEGQADVKGLGFKIEANDSDIKVTNMKITMTKGATGSTYLDRYASDVAVWMNGSKVATVNASDFSKDQTGVYSKSVALSNAVIKEGSANKATFYVTTSGISNIDTADMDATWMVAVSNFRFQDGTGVVMTDDATASNVLDVTDITSGDVKMVISRGSASPLAANVEVSSTGSTSDVLMLEVKAKNTGADMTTDTLAFDLATDATTLNEILGELVLKEGSTELASWSTFSSSVATQTVVFDLDEALTIKAGETRYFRVYANINDVDNFAQGKYLSVDYNKTASIFEVASTRTAFAETGAAVGEDQTFFSQGAIVKFVSDSYTAPTTDATPIAGTISMTFTVTAFGDADVEVSDGATNVLNTVTGASNAGAALVTSSGMTATGNPTMFTVSAGDTKTFTLSRKVTAVTGFVQLAITEVDGTVVSNVKTRAF